MPAGAQADGAWHVKHSRKSPGAPDSHSHQWGLSGNRERPRPASPPLNLQSGRRCVPSVCRRDRCVLGRTQSAVDTLSDSSRSRGSTLRRVMSHSSEPQDCADQLAVLACDGESMRTILSLEMLRRHDGEDRDRQEKYTARRRRLEILDPFAGRGVGDHVVGGRLARSSACGNTRSACSRSR